MPRWWGLYTRYGQFSQSAECDCSKVGTNYRVRFSGQTQKPFHLDMPRWWGLYTQYGQFSQGAESDCSKVGTMSSSMSNYRVRSLGMSKRLSTWTWLDREVYLHGMARFLRALSVACSRVGMMSSPPCLSTLSSLSVTPSATSCRQCSSARIGNLLLTIYMFVTNYASWRIILIFSPLLSMTIKFISFISQLNHCYWE